jgi:putative OPT family oligopeptide transporter
MSDEKKGLSRNAYEVMDGAEYKPYVPAEADLTEFTLKSVIAGIVLGIVFGAANSYLGLKVGITVSASIPAAVMSVAFFRLLRRGTILESNTVQTIGSAGESLAAGIIFTIPALFIWGYKISHLKIFIIATLGGILGILCMIPLRRYLISKEHGKLTYPEGTACAEVLVAGDTGGSKARLLFSGILFGGLYQFLHDSDFLGLWKSSPSTRIPGYKGAEVGADITPELLGVGYIIGPKIASVMFSGGALGWLVIIPLITLIGEMVSSPVSPSVDMLISEMEPIDIWDNYVRYIGAGAVALGGIVTLLKSLPTIYQSFVMSIKGFQKSANRNNEVRTGKDLSSKGVLIGLILIACILALLPQSFIPVGPLGAVFMVVFGFFFVIVSSRIVGLLGSSSNPVSGMTIATLLITALVFVGTGKVSTPEDRISILMVGAVVCIAAAIAGDTSQDLKTGFLVGATPFRQQIGEMIGVLTTALVMGSVLLILHEGAGIGSSKLPAPQATLMSMVIDGVTRGDLPWGLVFTGAFIALIIEIIGLPSLALAVGLYLPMSLSTPILIGGIIRFWVEKRYSGNILFEKRERGILYSSGLIAGAALIGVVIKGMIYLEDKWPRFAVFLEKVHNLTDGLGSFLSMLIFLFLTCTLIWKILQPLKKD